MKKIFFIFMVLGCVYTCNFQVQAQTVDELRKQRKEIQNRINSTNKLLQKTIKSEKESENKLNVLKKNLFDRRKLINSYNTEINILNSEIIRLTEESISLETQLNKSKKDYAKLIQNTQMNRNSYSKLMFLLSANDFDQSVRRARYLQEFAGYKKEQANQIEMLKKKIDLKSDSLNRHKSDKVVLLKTKESESAKLKKEEGTEKVLLAGLKKQEKKLTDEFREHQRKRDQIDRRIQQVIAEEIRKAEERKRAEEARRKKAAEELAKKNAAKGKPTTASSGKPDQQKSTTSVTAKPDDAISAYTREEKLLSGGFANNRGRLPWPVDRGVISGRFGTQPHPELKHVTINNKGTYFRSPVGTNARAVYDGVVTRLFALPGSGSAVIIQHGSYRTVYGNLSKVYVKEGDRVSAKQVIGQIFTDETNGQAELQFQIWSGNSMVNPEGWISR